MPRLKIRALSLVAIVVAMMACSSGEPPRPSATRSPLGSTSLEPVPVESMTESDILAAMADAATAKGSVHTVATLKQGSMTARFVTDTGATGGIQAIIQGPDRIEIRFVGTLVYLRGNEPALRDFGFPPPAAKKYANDWISFTESDPGYGDLRKSLDMPSLLEQVVLVGDLTKTDITTVEGKRVIGIAGEYPLGGTATLYVALDGDPLPVRLDFMRESVGNGTVLFSDWGKRVGAKAPASSTPYSEVEAQVA